jgi:hypothetical protein
MEVVFEGLDHLKSSQLSSLTEVLGQQDEFEECPPVSRERNRVEPRRPLAQSQAEGLAQIIQRRVGITVTYQWTGQQCTYQFG